MPEQSSKDGVILAVVEALLDAGDAPAAKDSRGKTPLEGVQPDFAFWETEAYRRLGG